ncbi:MAG: 4Fe-4S binding protein [Candidatus Lernaella stagnicola]|nr:4Fe-4S binding protein [Candidatus Lernaella stagnicola]
MITKVKVLKFDETAWKKPVVCDLARNFDITFSILKARVLPRQEGLLILETQGANGEFVRAVDFLRNIQGVSVFDLEKEILYDNEVCIQCGACTGFCPSGALHIANRLTMEVAFRSEDCIGCELCLTACPSRALTLAEDIAV